MNVNSFGMMSFLRIEMRFHLIFVKTRSFVGAVQMSSLRL